HSRHFDVCGPSRRALARRDGQASQRQLLTALLRIRSTAMYFLRLCAREKRPLKYCTGRADQAGHNLHAGEWSAAEMFRSLLKMGETPGVHLWILLREIHLSMLMWATEPVTAIAVLR
ncbi:MAG: hypothetical protein KBT44_05790, partial [Bacteroidales bacterium]|nr:hypothetical protein [Candidatus Equibacterium intestinale]